MLPLLSLLVVAARMCSLAAADNPSQLLFDMDARCLGSTGYSAALEVMWHPIGTLPHPFVPPGLGGSPAVPVHHPNPLATPKKKFPGTLMLIGELNLFGEQQMKLVDISKGTVHLQVPAWALQEGALSSLLLKQGDAVVGRMEFVQLAPLCGHGEHRLEDIDGGQGLPEIAIH